MDRRAGGRLVGRCLGGPDHSPACRRHVEAHDAPDRHEHRGRGRARWAVRPYRATVARPLGQANLPFNEVDARRGLVSAIETIDLDHDGRADVRAWVRSYADTGEPILVGVYTTFRHDDRGYVSVGFPLPTSNFTATLEPEVLDDGGLRPTSQGTTPEAGHFLSFIDLDRDELSVLELSSFGEDLTVRADRDGTLRAAHGFSLLGMTFLTLDYRITRATGGTRTAPPPRTAPS